MATNSEIVLQKRQKALEQKKRGLIAKQEQAGRLYGSLPVEDREAVSPATRFGIESGGPQDVALREQEGLSRPTWLNRTLGERDVSRQYEQLKDVPTVAAPGLAASAADAGKDPAGLKTPTVAGLPEPLAGPPRPAMLGPAPESYTSLQKGVREYRQRLGEDAQTEFTDADKARFAVPEGDYAGSNPSGQGTFNTIPGLTDAQIASVNQPQVDRPITGTPSATMPETSQWRQEVNRRNARMNAEEMADRARGFTKEGGYTRPTPEAQLDFMSDAMEDRSIGERQKSRQNTLRDVAQIKAGADQDTVIAGPDFGDQIATARLKFDRDKRKDSLAAVARGEERDARAAERARVATTQKDAMQAIKDYDLDREDMNLLAGLATQGDVNAGIVAGYIKEARAALPDAEAGDIRAAVAAKLGLTK